MEKFQTRGCREKESELSRGTSITRNVCRVVGECDCVEERLPPSCDSWPSAAGLCGRGRELGSSWQAGEKRQVGKGSVSIPGMARCRTVAGTWAYWQECWIRRTGTQGREEWVGGRRGTSGLEFQIKWREQCRGGSWASKLERGEEVLTSVCLNWALSGSGIGRIRNKTLSERRKGGWNWRPWGNGSEMVSGRRAPDVKSHSWWLSLGWREDWVTGWSLTTDG